NADFYNASDDVLSLNFAQYSAVTATKLTTADVITVVDNSAALTTQTITIKIDKITVTGAANFTAATNASGDLGGAGIDTNGEWVYTGGTLTYFDVEARTITLTGVTQVEVAGGALTTFLLT
ncbi:MAG: VCBS domain-containing protein, partial [Caldisericota bacterium]|nr:VCBS domain-containing protein [Caldisericota bacterium]